MQKIEESGTTTVPVPDHRELRTGTLLSIVRQSGLPRSEFESEKLAVETGSDPIEVRHETVSRQKADQPDTGTMGSAVSEVAAAVRSPNPRWRPTPGQYQLRDP